MIDLGKLSLKELYDLRVQVSNLIEGYETEAAQVMEAGGEATGFSYAKGRSTRSVRSLPLLVQDAVELGLERVNFYQPKPLGVPAIEKLLNSKLEPDEATRLLSKHIEVVQGKPKLVYTGE